MASSGSNQLRSCARVCKDSPDRSVVRVVIVGPRRSVVPDLCAESKIGTHRRATMSNVKKREVRVLLVLSYK